MAIRAPMDPQDVSARQVFGETTYFDGAGVRLAASILGPQEATPVVLLHGGGQTRFAWKGALSAIAAQDYRAVTVDLRGHGDSDWAKDGNYHLDTLADDIDAIVRQLGRAPVLVGASLGGLASLLAVGDHKVPARALILVDIAPHMEPEGADKIGAFMHANPDGFASIEEAADAVAGYLPHRPRPRDPSGLMKNLRARDGRLYWHWDPQMMGGRRGSNRGLDPDRLDDAARALSIPTLLIRGGLSQIVSMDSVNAFLAVAPHAEFVDVAGADHMVAGDANDPFNEAVIDFISRHVPATPD